MLSRFCWRHRTKDHVWKVNASNFKISSTANIRHKKPTAHGSTVSLNFYCYSHNTHMHRLILINWSICGCLSDDGIVSMDQGERGWEREGEIVEITTFQFIYMWFYSCCMFGLFRIFFPKSQNCYLFATFVRSFISVSHSFPFLLLQFTRVNKTQ